MWPEADFREIRAFLLLAEELHFARTAERLGITSARVSQMIRSLEARLGGRLFERTSRRVRLTPLGEQLLSEIAHPYGELQEVLARAGQGAGGVGGTLRIGLYSLLSGGPHMTDIVRTFKTRHPRCELEFINISYERGAREALDGGEVDMLATRLPLSASEVTIGPVLSCEERVLLVAGDDPLARRPSISYEDIADRVVSDVTAFPRQLMDAFVPPVTPSGRVLKRIPNRSPEDTLMRVALGEQVHPTVRSFLDHHSHPGVVSVPIRDLPPSETALVWLTANRRPAIDAFARAAADVIGRAVVAERGPPAEVLRSSSG
ncbi:MAG TPA: LysR family transcriptional regulator [Solirubrobacteraceae bacterium]|nr:LysR family transcriptional regulator [Solirubrobacteraceae bacterium]